MRSDRFYLSKALDALPSPGSPGCPCCYTCSANNICMSENATETFRGMPRAFLPCVTETLSAIQAET